MNVIAGVALLISFASFEAPTCSATGDLQIVPFQSNVFPAPRNLRVLLPPGYSLPQNRNRRYPVLYLNDGLDLFDVCTSIFGTAEWQVDETVDRLVKAGKLPPIIVVGIDNGGKRLRPREYLPYPDKTLFPPEPDPQGKLYPRFLLEEVVPFVEKRYRVLPGPRNRALGGSSYGAGIALYTIISRPGTFSGLPGAPGFCPGSSVPTGGPSFRLHNDEAGAPSFLRSWLLVFQLRRKGGFRQSSPARVHHIDIA